MIIELASKTTRSSRRARICRSSFHLPSLVCHRQPWARSELSARRPWRLLVIIQDRSQVAQRSRCRLPQSQSQRSLVPLSSSLWLLQDKSDEALQLVCPSSQTCLAVSQELPKERQVFQSVPLVQRARLVAKGSLAGK